MNGTLLFEIGLEELPVSFVKSALAALPRLAEAALKQARLEHGDIQAIGTPRRLTLVVQSLADAQPDLSEVVTGPPEGAAFDKDGTPKKAAIGFAKKLGLPVEALEVVETEKGRYVAGKREEAGKPAAAVLPGLLSSLCPKIPFPKSMRWGAGDIAFGRPVHWMVALHGDTVLPATFAGVTAGRVSRGHRFLSPAEFELASADDYVDALRGAHVVVDTAERQKAMADKLASEAEAAGGVLVEDAFLLEENTTLVEEPHVVCGGFDEAFLTLPDEVTIEVMKGHQRYFALRSTDGKLLPRYLAVVNTALAPDVIRLGNDRVLRARLADARFFVEEDLNRGLEAMVPVLDQVVFQTKLGTVGERVARLGQVCAALGDDGPAQAAARLCKADLVSLIIGEFPELQGLMGRWYATKAGVDAAVAEAIETHYQPRGAKDGVPTSAVAARLAVADRADALVGCFGIGLVPSGSADPFALRRASLGMIRIAIEGPIDVDVRASLKAAHAAYAGQDKPVATEAEVLASLDTFFRARLKAFHGDRLATELVDACLGAWDGGSIRDLSRRLDALETFRQEAAFESLAVAFKRAHNLAVKEAPDAGPYDVSAMTEDAERALAAAWSSLEAEITAAAEQGDYGRALSRVAETLREPIDRFFEEVFVMVDDTTVRDNRLRLLASIDRALSAIAHFHLLGGS
ncbi:MAG: glycine--tRNA ligase subunit beta [Sandaracinaceae bacterium]